MLIDEITKAQRNVKTDAYQMSVGELVNMYKDGELLIDPDFQRLFRWEIGQKTKLIESLLLGIPIPSIFVFERDDAKWELVDGLQRISTLLEFMGLLRAPEDNDTILPPSILVGAGYLPSLNNIVWEISERIQSIPTEEQIEIDKPLQLAIRRSRITVEILKRPSSNATKYDLFQRLNAGGTPANAQELRNCIVIMANKQYFLSMKSLAEMQTYLHVLSASQDQIDKQRHLEYVSRFLVYTYIPYDGTLDVEEYIDQGLVTLATADNIVPAIACFTRTFQILDGLYGENALRRIVNGAPSGRVGLAAFECIAIGVAKNIATISLKPAPEQFVKERIEAFWASNEWEPFFAQGMRGTTRIQRTIPFGEAWFNG